MDVQTGMISQLEVWDGLLGGGVGIKDDRKKARLKCKLANRTSISYLIAAVISTQFCTCFVCTGSTPLYSHWLIRLEKQMYKPRSNEAWSCFAVFCFSFSPFFSLIVLFLISEA